MNVRVVNEQFENDEPVQKKNLLINDKILSIIQKKWLTGFFKKLLKFSTDHFCKKAVPNRFQNWFNNPNECD